MLSTRTGSDVCAGHGRRCRALLIGKDSALWRVPEEPVDSPTFTIKCALARAGSEIYSPDIDEAFVASDWLIQFWILSSCGFSFI